MASIINKAITDEISRTPFQASLQECFKLTVQLEAGYQLLEGVNLARAANIMSLQAEDMYKTRNDIRAISNACFKYGILGHFVRDYTVGTMDPADDTTSHIGGKMHTTVAAKFPCDGWSP